MIFKSEQELAAKVVSWLSEFEWTVYQEVRVGGYGPIADIVATRGPILRVIECKMSFTATLAEQALRHKTFAHYVHVAVPSKQIDKKGSFALERLLMHEGIGLLNITPTYISEWRKAKFFRKAFVEDIRRHLKEEHKTYAAAGNAKNQYWTPWRSTCDNWKRYVEQHPGCTLKEIISNEGHHYASDVTARTAMAKWITAGKVKGITCVRDKKNKILLYPENS